MYYRLRENFLLRGYERLPYAIIDTKTGAANFITSEMFNALELCNGKIDLSLPIISEKIRECVKVAETAGVIEPTLTPQSINDKQEYKFYKARYIRQAHFSITGKCNYKCKHCYMSAPDAKYGELSHDVILNIIQQMSDCGIMNVSLTGGEPLVREDFLDIVDALLERDINITQIYSNGALVNEKLLNELDARNIHPEFNMSYDGAGWHDWLRGINGAEKIVNRAFSLCRDMGFPTGSEMCLHEYNKHTLRESIKHLGSLGVKSLKVNPVSNVGEWAKNNLGQSINFKELFNIYLEYIPEYYQDDMPLNIMLGGLFAARKNEPDYFVIPVFKPDIDPESFCICGHARLVMYISPEGRTLPCMALAGMNIQEKFPLITQNSLSDCINNSFYMQIINTRASEYLALNEICNNCKYSRHCYGGCRADALEHGNNLMGKSPGTCEIFRGGWVDKVIKAVKQVRPNAKSLVFESALWQNLE